MSLKKANDFLSYLLVRVWNNNDDDDILNNLEHDMYMKEFWFAKASEFYSTCQIELENNSCKKSSSFIFEKGDYVLELLTPNQKISICRMLRSRGINFDEK